MLSKFFFNEAENSILEILSASLKNCTLFHFLMSPNSDQDGLLLRLIKIFVSQPF